ncbi:MAG TPA: phosphoribosylglycinamide formyltransferase [Candidatus Limiplasma sp.]|nr:phosphoribosylglycinamide formyltransferase [Candidatus Limiplasma sp.]
MVKIAVLVSGGGTNLQALLDAQRDGRLKSGKIALVVSSKADAYALTRARDAGIETAVLPKAESPEAYGMQLIELLRLYQIDMVVLAGFMLILHPNVVRAYAGRILNVHPSLIPSFCGAGYYGLKVHRAALDYGVKVTGATVHIVNEIPDGGKILAQKAVKIKKGDTPETLQKRVMEKAEWKLLPQETEKLAKKIAKKEKKH